jgi:hypothetical protein
MVLGRVPFTIMSDSPALHSRWLLLLKIEISSKKNQEYRLSYSFPCSCSKYLSSFRFIIKQQWTIEEISIFSNSSHLEWRAGLSDTNLKGTHPGSIPARFGLSISALVQVKMSSNFNCSYMARSSLTYIPDFSVKFFFQPIYTVYAN